MVRHFRPFAQNNTLRLIVDDSNVVGELILPDTEFVSATIRVFNDGTVPVMMSIGGADVDANSQTAVPIAPGRTEGFHITSKDTHIAFQTASGGVVAYVTAGTGAVLS